MMRLPAAIYVATEPVNLHLSFDRLAGIVRQQLDGDPRSEALYVFHNRRGTHVKILWHDKSGYCIFYKRLDHGVYRIPLAIPAGASHVTASRRELELLLEGIDRRALRAARRVVETRSTTRRSPR
ncbi:MAG: IS66 family insertion sequence element accessory protein TnpB [Polyangiaceae bacterium]|nr:IS66 family insertion sequence element accessory protein TnpB [Polyangiaceae bacterium]